MEYAVIFLPLVGSVIGYFGKSLTIFFFEIVTSLFTTIAALISLVIFYNGLIYNDYGTYKILNGSAQEIFPSIGLLRLIH